MPYMRLHRAPDAADAAPGSPIIFTAATAGRKADGLDLSGLPWDFSRGVGDDAKRYPFLWVHDLGGDNLPLGIAEVISEPDALPLRVAVTCDPEDEFAQRVERKYRSPVGGLSAVSISWDDMDADGMPARMSGKKAVAHQLLEVSAVPVPLDAGALKDDAKRAALRALRDDLDAVLEDEPVAADKSTVRALEGSLEAGQEALVGRIVDAISKSGLFGNSWVYVMATYPDDGYVVVCVYPENKMAAHYQIEYTDGETVTLGNVTPVVIREVAVVSDGDNAGRASRTEDDEWADVAAAMVDVFARDVSTPEGARSRSYKALKSAYVRLNRTWPEWVPSAELRAMDDDNWRALFLAGELEVSGIRAGAELSRQNFGELEGVRDAMADCVKRMSALLERVSSKQQAKGEDTEPEAAGRDASAFDWAAVSAYLDSKAVQSAGGNDDD